MFCLASLNLSLLILIIIIYSLILPAHHPFTNANVNLPDSCTEHSSISDAGETYIIPSLTSYCKELIFRDSTVYFISIRSQSFVEKITLKNITCTRNDPGGCIQFDSTLGGALRTIVIDNIEHAFNNGDGSVVQTTGEFHIVAFDQTVQANTTSTTSMLMTSNSISITNLFLRNAHLEHASGAIGFNGLKFGGEVAGFDNITISGILFEDCSFRALGSSVGIRAMTTAAGNSFIGGSGVGSILHVSNIVQRNLEIKTNVRIEFWGPSFSGAVSNFSKVLIEDVTQEYLKINLNRDRISFAGIYLRSSILGMSSSSSTSTTTTSLHLARLTQREISIVSASASIPVDGFVLEGSVGGFDTVTFEHVNQSSFFMRSSADGSSFYALSTPGTATLNGAAPNVHTKLTISNLTQEHLDIVSARILTVYVLRVEGGFKDFSSTEISRIVQRNITAAVDSPSGMMGIRTVLLYGSMGASSSSSSSSSSSTATSSNITFDEIHQSQCLLTVNSGFIAATVLYVGRRFSGFTKVVAKNIYQIDVNATASSGAVDFFPFRVAEGGDIVGTGTGDSLFSISNVFQRNLRGTTSTSDVKVFSIYSQHKISNFSSVVFSDLRQEHIVGRSTESAIHASLVTLTSSFEGPTTEISSSSSFTLSNGFQHNLDLLSNQLTTVSCLNLEQGAVNFGRITVEDITQESIVVKIETSHNLGVRVLVFHGIDQRQAAAANHHKSIEGGVHIRNISQLHCRFSTGSGFIVANILYFPKKVSIRSNMNVSSFLQDNVTATSDSNSIAFHGFSTGEDGDVYGDDDGSVFSLSNVTQRRLRGSSNGQVNVHGAIIDNLRTLSNFSSVIFDEIIQEDIVLRAESNFSEVSGVRCHGSVKAASISSSPSSFSTFQLSNAIQRDIDTESGQRIIISHLRQVAEISGFTQVILSNTTQVRISASYSRSTNNNNNNAVMILVNSFLLQGSITSSRQETSSPGSSTSFRVFNVLQSHISTTSCNEFISLSAIRFDGTVSLFDCVEVEHVAQIHSSATLISDVAGRPLTILIIEVNSAVFVEGYSSSSSLTLTSSATLVRVRHTRQFNVSGNASNEGFVVFSSSLVASASISNVSQLVFENSTSDFIRGFSARDAVFVLGVSIDRVEMAAPNSVTNSISFQGIRISNVILTCGELDAARFPSVGNVRTINTLTNVQELLVTDLVVQNVTVASGSRARIYGFSVDGSIDFLSSSSSSSSLRRLTISHLSGENVLLATRSASFVNQEFIVCLIFGRISNLDSFTVFNISTISPKFMLNYHLPAQEGGMTNEHQPDWILLKSVVLCYGVAMMKLVDVRSVHIDYVVVSDLNVGFHQQHQPSSLTDTRVAVKSVLLAPSSSVSQSSIRSSIDIGRSCIRGVSVVHVSAGQQQQPQLLLSQPPNISTVHIVTSTQSLVASNISIHRCELINVIMNSSSSSSNSSPLVSLSSSLVKFGAEEIPLGLGEAVESEFPVMDSTIVMKSNILYVSSAFNSSITNGSSCALLSFPKSSTTRSNQNNNNNALPDMMKLMLEDNNIVVQQSSSSSTTPSSTLSAGYPGERIANDHILAVLSSSSSTTGSDFDLRQSAWILGCNQWPNSVSRLFGKNIEQQNNAHFEFTCQSQTPSPSRPSSSVSVSHPTPSSSVLFTASRSNSSNDGLTSSSSYSSAQTHSHSTSDITPTPSNMPPVPPYISPLKEVYNSMTQASVFTQLTSPAMAVQALRSKSILSSIDKILAGNCNEIKDAKNGVLNELAHKVPDPVASPLQIELPSSAGGFIGGTVVGNILFVPIVCLGTLILWMIYKVAVLKEPVGKRDMPMFDRTTKKLILKARKHGDDNNASSTSKSLTRAKMMKNDSFLDMIVKSKSHHLVMNSFLMLLLPLLLACAELSFIPATNTIFTVFAILVSGVFLLLFFWVLVKLLLLRKRKHERLFSRSQTATEDTSTFSYDMNSSGLDEIDLEQMRFDVAMMKESMQIDDVDTENKKKHNINNNRKKKKKHMESRTTQEEKSSTFSSVLTFVRWLNSCSGEWKIPHMKLSSRIEKERQEQIKKMKSMMKKVTKKNNNNQVTTNLARLLTPANADVISDTDLLFGRSHNSSSSLTMKRISREDARLFYLTLPFIEDYSESTASYFMFIEVGLIIGLLLSEFLALWVFGSCQALGIMSVVVVSLHLLALLVLKPYINVLNKYSSPILEVAQIALLVLVLDVSSSSSDQQPPKDVIDTIATFQVVIAVLQIIVSVISGLGVMIDVFDRFHQLKKRRELHDEREELIPKYRLALLHHHNRHSPEEEEDVNEQELGTRMRGEQHQNTNKNSNQKDQQRPQKMKQRDKDLLEMLEFYNNNNNQKNDEDGNSKKETELSASLLLSSPRVAAGDNDKKKNKRRPKKKKSRTALEEDNRKMNHVEL